MATATTLRQHFREIKHGRPGRRFQDHYCHSKAERRKQSVGRIVRLVAGIIAVVVGLILCVIPGPGIPFIFLGGAFLAAESLNVARILDWIELRGRKVWDWLVHRWDALPLWGKIPVALLVAAAGIASMWFFWQLMN